MRSLYMITVSMLCIYFAGSVLSAPIILPLVMGSAAIMGGADGFVKSQTARAKVEKQKQDAVNRHLKQYVAASELQNRRYQQYLFAVIQNILSRSDNSERSLVQVIDFVKALKKYNPNLVPDNYGAINKALADVQMNGNMKSGPAIAPSAMQGQPEINPEMMMMMAMQQQATATPNMQEVNPQMMMAMQQQQAMPQGQVTI